MIPESIFITVDIDPAGKEHINMADNTEYGRIKYVRAATLLRWAKEERSLLDESLGLAAGERIILQKVIDKLESL